MIDIVRPTTSPTQMEKENDETRINTTIDSNKSNSNHNNNNNDHTNELPNIILIALLCITCGVCIGLYSRKSRQLKFAREKLNILQETVHVRNNDDIIRYKQQSKHKGFIKGRSKSHLPNHHHGNKNKKNESDRGRGKSHNNMGTMGNIDVTILKTAPNPLQRVVSQTFSAEHPTISSHASQYSPKLDSNNKSIEMRIMSPTIDTNITTPYIDDDEYSSNDEDEDNKMYNQGSSPINSATPMGPNDDADTDEGTDTGHDDIGINHNEGINKEQHDSDDDIWMDPMDPAMGSNDDDNDVIPNMDKTLGDIDTSGGGFRD